MKIKNIDQYNEINSILKVLKIKISQGENTRRTGEEKT